MHSTAKPYPSPYLADFRKDLLLLALIMCGYVHMSVGHGVGAVESHAMWVLGTVCWVLRQGLNRWPWLVGTPHGAQTSLQLPVCLWVSQGWWGGTVKALAVQAWSLAPSLEPIGWKGIPDLSDLLPQIYGMHTSALYTHYTHIWIFKICLRIYECV